MHDKHKPVGALTAMQETPEGLEVSAKIATNTDAGAEAYELAKTGALAFSVGAMIGDADDTDSGRVLKSAELLELSLVTVPAQSGAVIRTVKEFDSRKEFEAALRDALGLSRTQAKRLAAGGYRAMTDTDELPEEVSEAVTQYLAELDSLKDLALATVQRKRKAVAKHDAETRARKSAAPMTFQALDMRGY